MLRSLVGSEMCIRDRAGWTETQKGIVLGSFYIGYMITQIWGGLLSDRIGAKIVLGVGLVVWSLFTLIAPVGSKFSTLLKEL